MGFGLKWISGPEYEPISLKEAKNWLKQDQDIEDGLIESLITTARSMVENYLRKILIQQTWEYSLDSVGSFDYDDYKDVNSDYPWSLALPGKSFIEIPKPPLINVVSIKYYNLSNVEATWASTNYGVDTRSKPGRIYLNSGCTFPSELRAVDAFVIQFECGYGNIEEIPAAIKTSILRLVGFLYENRQLEEIPAGLRNILDPFRELRI